MFHNGLKLVSAMTGLLLLVISLSIKLSSAITYDGGGASHQTQNHRSRDIEVVEKV